PRAFSTTATHDTKRGEDVRARLNVLSEIPGEWREALTRWSELNRPLRPTVEEELVPDANEEYFLYQTLVGTWPLELGARSQESDVREVVPFHQASVLTPVSCHLTLDYVRRIQDYMHKALHEAKVHTSWVNPDPTYDEAVRQFIAQI